MEINIRRVLDCMADNLDFAVALAKRARARVSVTGEKN
jgi:hypothetical protein